MAVTLTNIKPFYLLNDFKLVNLTPGSILIFRLKSPFLKNYNKIFAGRINLKPVFLMDKIQTIKSIYSQISLVGAKKENYVLATVTSVYGSTPQKPGSSALFGKSGLIAGTVGGGAVEHNISNIALDAVKNKKSGYIKFNLTNQIDEENGPICGGGMNILVDASPEKHAKIFASLQNSLEKRIPGILLTFAESQNQEEFSIKRHFLTSENKSEAGSLLKTDVLKVASEMLNYPVRSDFREMVIQETKHESRQYVFFETILPPPRLLIAGAGHVGKALSHLGKLLDFEVLVWDDRVEYSNKKNLPDADHTFSGNMKKIFNKAEPDKNTYIVIVTRDHKNDAEVLKTFIGSNAGYIGMMGSKRKIVQLKEQFIENGWATPDEWNKIYTPIGLEIHSKTVQEIAVSIAAQLVQVRNEINVKNG